MKAQRRFNRLLLAGGSVCLLVVFALSSFLSPAPFAPTARAQPIAVGLVPDGPLNDQAFNWNSYQGLRRAEEELGVAGTVYTPTLGFDEALGRCVADGNDLCLAVGFAAGDATRDAANANPGTDFAIVDLSYETYPDNLRGIVFAADQGAYLAGTLAALMTDSDVLGVIGGLPIPPVDDFIYGFRNGARCANISATVLISYTYDFMNPDLGAQYARAMMDAGADVIFAPAGGTAAGAVLTATQSGVWGIGVDVDFYYTVFASGTVPGSDRLLTSALKRLDNAVFQTIADVVSGTFTPGTRRYDLAEDGVGIAPFHDADPFVPQPVRDHLELVRQGLVGGTIDPGDPCWAPALYVDAAHGSNEGDCAAPGAPCASIGYALNLAQPDDPILVAAGTYTESLYVDKRVSLVGGYSGWPNWQRNLQLYPTTLQAADATAFGDWDGSDIYRPAVISATGAYQMWYSGRSLLTPGRIGYAESSDGIVWTRPLTHAVLLEGGPGDWDEMGVAQPAVIWQGGLYQMWYLGTDNVLNQIGYATSTNGIDWIKYAGNPVLQVGVPGEWDDAEVGGPSVVFDGTTYHLWYHGSDGSVFSIGYATSTNGIDWVKYAANPVLGPADPGNWDGDLVFFPTVVTDSGHLSMWYSTNFKPEGGRGIGYVTSTNAISWTRSLTEPVLPVGGPGEWDEQYVQAPAVVADRGTLHMWYTGYAADWAPPPHLGYATSPDGIGWTKSISNPVFGTGDPVQWGKPVVILGPGSDGALLDGFIITGADVGYDGAVSVRGAAPTIRSCLIRDNVTWGPQEWGAGGILVGEGAAPTVEQCLIVGNTAHGGGSGVRIGGASSLTVVNSLIAGNNGRPAIHANDAALVLTNVTIADNHDVGLLLNGAQATVLNSVLWEVDAAEIEAPNGSLYKVDFSNIEDGVLTGTGNISQDPLFVGGGDYHLGAGSPCIDVGTAAGTPAYDWEGDPRPFGGGVDMGADEWWVRLGVSLGADSAARSGAPGAAVTYILVLTNTGEYTDSYDLAAGGVWTPTLSLGTAGPLAPGAGSTFTLTVAVPADASGGAMDTTAVTATSTLGTSTRASILVTTTARQVEFRVYLPLVLRGYGR